MRKAGEVIYVDVNKDQGYGVVEYRNQDEMNRAIDDMHDTEIGGSKVSVKVDPERDRPRMQSTRGGRGGFSSRGR